MASCKPQVFSGVTAGQYAALMAKAKSVGMDISGTHGRASRMGVEVEWTYSEEKQELVLTCLRTPFFVSEDQVNEQLQTLVKQALAD